jgi:tRNA pseudouridine32 synthase / 23S rRNA pseudouridine746 synthase
VKADPLPKDEPSTAERSHKIGEAVERLQRAIEGSAYEPALVLEGGGKMFGVLLARDSSGAMQTLHAFSGMLDGGFEHEGFVPPVFDARARASIEGPGLREVQRLDAIIHSQCVEAGELAALDAAHAQAREAMRVRHATNKRDRHARRAANVSQLQVSSDALRRVGSSATPPVDLALTLAQESRADKAQARRLEDAHEAARAPFARVLLAHERRRSAAKRVRRMLSADLMRRIHGTYVLTNSRGESRALRSLFPAEPPSGAGECAAPKLLAAAFARGLTPVALREVFIGSPTATSDRRSGHTYPPCKKCEPILAFMSEGLSLDIEQRPRPAFSDAPLVVLYEDAHLLVVDKPAGLLSVPGKASADSALARLRLMRPKSPELMLAHRLDLETSGVLIAAKGRHTYVALQRAFAERQISKTYVAWVDGVVANVSGRIDLALRPDVEDRPRQIHDPVHGKLAHTTYRVLDRADKYTKLELTPLTGRTHQLRVHSAHPLGLFSPIVGDRLYGRADTRLFLHAESVKLTHPHTHETIEIRSPETFSTGSFLSVNTK